MSDIVEVLLPNALDHGFDYRVPEGLRATPGTIVSVPLGSKKTLGIVWGDGKAEIDAKKIKSIAAVHERFPALSEKFRKFLQWAAWYNGAPLGNVIKMVLPIADIEKKGRLVAEENIAPPTIISATLSADQRAAAERLAEKLFGGFSVSLLDGVTGSGKTEVYFEVIARALKDSGFRIQDSGEKRDNKDRPNTASSFLPESRILNPESSQILVLLPEIALSVQWLARFRERFGFAPVVWHSHITPARRRLAWQLIASGEARVVVGARSALFLPYPNLSMIVVDEEHDGSYKQEEGVIYHARDMAIARARHEQFPVLLVSATPSLETVQNVRAGKYSEVTLPIRHAEAQMPTLHLLDMRLEKLPGDRFISDTLRQAIADAVAAGHQAMLFLNRRGYAPLVLCRTCGHRFQCPHCSAWLVQHQTGKRQGARGKSEDRNAHASCLMPNASLHCHHCDYRIPLPSHCPGCEKEHTLHACGPGVERIVEEVESFLPQARVATLASDSTSNHQELSAIILGMERREIDLLIGTQMIAKGHHFGGLAVVGVVDADLGLNGGDLRAAEKTYQLLHQISGRAGREQVAGHVYLQSYNPDHPVMQALASGGRDAFLTAELESRKQADMPPFSRLAALIIEGHREEEVVAVCKALSRSAVHDPRITIYGPAPAPLSLLRGKYRYRFLVHAQRNMNVPDMMHTWVSSIKPPRSVRIKTDIDPMSFM